MEEGCSEGRASETEDTDRNDPKGNGSEIQYKSEEKEGNYSKEVYHSRSKSKPETKPKSSKSSKLESIIESLKREAKESNIEGTEFVSAHIYKEISNYLEEEDSERDTWEGAVAIIYNAKKREFLIEEEYGKQAGKLRLIGGQKEFSDANTFETEAREIEEEVKEPAKHILLKYLRKSGTRYGSIINVINGGEVISDIIKIHVSSPKDWEIISNAKPTGGAGHFYNKTFDELWSMPNNAFAYDHGPVIKKFILEEITKNNYQHKGFHYTGNHTLPLVTTNYYHLRTMNSFNQPLISNN